jgi:hypothetical protein
MQTLTTDFLIGTTISSVPIYVLTKYYFENNLTLAEYDYKSEIMYMPIKIGLLNSLLFFLANKFFPDYSKNPIVMGSIMSIVLSFLSSDKSFNFIPNNVIKMKNNNLFHIYSVIIFIILYFFLLKIKI